MEYETSRRRDGPVVNMLQVVALDIVLTLGLLVALKLAGAGWLLATFAAWIGGCLLTLAAVFTIYKLALISERRSHRAAARVAEAIKVWETDRLMELGSAAQDTGDSGTEAADHTAGKTPNEDAHRAGVPTDTDKKHARRA